MPLRAIFFDLDDTLVDDTVSLERCGEVAAAELAPGIGVSPSQLADGYVEAAIRFWTELGPNSPKPASGAIRPSMWHRALLKFGIDDRALASRLAKRYDELRVDTVELYPDALRVLAELHGRYRLVIITNGYVETHEDKIARLEIARFFDHVVLAGELALVKPDPAVFAHAMALAKVGPDESVMVGDRFDRDIVGAHAAGMPAIWVNVRDERLPTGARPPEATISSIGELPEALEKLTQA